MSSIFFGLCIWSVFLAILTPSVIANEFSHEWAVQIKGGEEIAKDIAARNNFEYLGKIFDDVFHMRSRRLAKRSARPSAHHHHKLTREAAVLWAEQQKVRRRVKRDFAASSEEGHRYGKPHKQQRSDRTHRLLRVEDDEDQVHALLDDPKWPSMWYLNRGGSLDMNVQRAWRAGVTGKGVVVTILDDGLEKDHPDLIRNYDPYASYDVNGRDADPMPRYDLIDSNRHGTRCAGEVAADANNSICAVGVAFEASVGGVRMLDGDVTDAVEARSLSLFPQHIDIYSASWGPDDDGKTVDGPGQLATRAFMDGVATGRDGKGSIFVWASGNGGRDQDNCNCDGYTNSIWTLSISSATEKGTVPWYSEACSSTLATTYSSGAMGQRQIITTDLHHGCTTAHTGTSASAPLAAGICALALHANMNLSWRDMQHVVVRTARPDNLIAPDWQINGVGRKVSHRFGYGLMDAHGMVQLARNWTTVPPQHRCQVPSEVMNKLIPQKSSVTLTMEVSDCPGVKYLEHVQAKVTLSADRRGDIKIFLTSPAGTRSNLLARRYRDSSRAGFRLWPFMTVHMWGESPLGIWKLEVHNNGTFYSPEKGNVHNWTLLLYGTDTVPGVPSVGNLPAADQTAAKSPLEEHNVEPSHTPSFVDHKLDSDSRRLSNEGGARSSGPATASPSIPQQAKGLPGCATTSSVGKCLACHPGLVLNEGQCVVSCPDNFFVTSETPPSRCSKCHYSCRKCKGPFDYECSECWPDAAIVTPTKEESFCTSLWVSHTLIAANQTWWSVPVLLLLIFSVLMAILILFYCNRTPHQVDGVSFTKDAMGRVKGYAPIKLFDSTNLADATPFHDLSDDEDVENPRVEEEIKEKI